METSVDKTMDRVSYTQSNPLFEMSLSRSDLYSFQPDDLKPARPRRQWCFNVVVAYIIFQTTLNVFLLYKVFTLESSLSNIGSGKLASIQSSLGGEQGSESLHSIIYNNSQEAKSMRSFLWALQSQVTSLCGEEGQLERLRVDLSLLNTSTHNLQGQVATLSLKPGGILIFYISLFFLIIQRALVLNSRRCSLSGDLIPVCFFPGDTGAAGPPGQKGEKGLTGQPGRSGEAGQIVNVRLVPGRSRGRVEVRYNGIWGTVCDDSFDTVDAKVICKMLGFQSVISTFSANAGSGRIWLDELRCLGRESDIFSCPHSGMGVNNCDHSEDIGVQCA
uniref:Macrophage receptor with collagenous structure n=1 Tax=Mastacembelus armatus TaxID=205130 RepID=A0A7N8XZQ9_9TELE